jgi:hypothetical protein
MLYVAGLIWAEIKQLYQEGIHQYIVKKSRTSILDYKNCWNILGGYLEFIRLDN